MRLSVAMMAHPRREASVDRMLAALDRDCLVVWDRYNDRHETGRRAMLAYDPAAEYHAVIQDDLLVCRDLFAGLERALEVLPADTPLSAYTGAVRPYKRQINRALSRQHRPVSWLVMDGINWGPLLVVPTSHIPAMVDYYDSLVGVPNYDRRVSRYWRLRRGSDVWYTWPSLVDHADGPSLVEGRSGTARDGGGHPRVAHTFLGEDRSALDVDWTGAAVPVTTTLIVGRMASQYPPIVDRRPVLEGR